MTERGAGQPRFDLSTSIVQTGFGRMMSVRGDYQPSGWFGPQAPLAPIAPPQVAGRQFDLQPGYNIVQRPRSYEQIGFEQLRALADNYDLLRLVIETRKDQIERVRWGIRQKQDRHGNPRSRVRLTDDARSRIDRVHEFLERPDGENSFRFWLRMLFEDLLVIDAPTLWRQTDRGGRLLYLHPLDGGTIKRVIDDWGRTPRPYEDESGRLVYPVAYQQVLKGYAAVDYTVQDLIYAPRNKRSNKVYGYSPVEQIIMTVNIALRRQLGTLSYYTAGNIPDSLIGVPDSWTPDQIKVFQDHWDSYFTGEQAARRSAKFVPGGVAKTFIQTREPELKGVFDEWLARLVCFAFSTSPQALVAQQNRATASVSKEQAEEEGLSPMMMWTKELIDPIISQDLGCPDLEFAWGDDDQIEPLTEKDILVGYVNAGLLTRNEARGRIGEELSDAPEADLLGFTTAAGFVPLEESKKPEPPAALSGPSGYSETTGEDEDEDENVTAKLAKNDWEHQPRDNMGRFGSAGGPTARERKKSARRSARGDDGVARDSHGRFASGKITQETVKNTAKKIGYKVAVAAAAGAAAVAVTKLKPGHEVSEGIAKVAKTISKTLLTSSAETVLSTAIRYFGADAETAKKTARTVRRVIMDIIKSDGESLEDLTAEEAADTYTIARTLLPPFFAQLRDALELQLEERGVEQEKIDAVSAQMAADAQEIVRALGDAPMRKRSAARQLLPLSYDRPVLRRLEKSAARTIYRILQDAWEASAPTLRAALSDVSSEAEKAAGTDDPRAARLARGLDLSAVERIRIELAEELTSASSDAAQRVLIQLGVGDDEKLTGRVFEKAAAWAEDHAAELSGVHELEGGVRVSKTTGGYTIPDGTQDIVRRTIASGLREGLSAEEIAEKVQEAGFSEERARNIAEYEIGSANSAGALEGYRAASAAGVEVRKSWLTVGDDGVDEDVCKKNEEQGPIPVDQEFQSGHMAPLGHPHCRCVLVPVVMTSEEVEED